MAFYVLVNGDQSVTDFAPTDEARFPRKNPDRLNWVRITEAQKSAMIYGHSVITGWTHNGRDFVPPPSKPDPVPPSRDRVLKLEAALIAKGLVTKLDIDGA